ncbi:spore photoproduct lyase [Tumebacillus sp. BK434]|uniref:spore photoproduct lyase n=1 Tax=Tumebacillus sp. BK434 TaxID=2512169 RepID=UPI00104342B0|nr:spore photoproduct lyase [Tumebacillus sp. BK434]TCP55384.1 spore photoproduct lyase [Tumebacillus sp. BK434]
MTRFEPDLVFFEPKALDYPVGDRLYRRLKDSGVPIKVTSSHNRVTGIPGDTPSQAYANAKRTLVVGVKRTMKLDTSKPSADFALPVSTGCPGHCHYCYLQTTMGKKPYVRVYVNIDEILDNAQTYIDERAPETTTFEAACTSDPIAVEHLTGNLKRMIEFMGEQELAQLRFVTKYDDVEQLLDAKHNGKTRFRFSINSRYVIKNFEPGVAPFDSRIAAAGKVAQAGYPLGFIVAPLIIYEGWEAGYAELFERLSRELIPEAKQNLTFELIQHRFTAAAKRIILQNYPATKLEMDEEQRKYKYGKYGRGKWVYQGSDADRLNLHLRGLIEEYFPQAKIEYFT